MRSIIFTKYFAALALLLSSNACANRNWNDAKENPRTAAPVEYHPFPDRKHDGTFVVLAFSGGGTRAAALAYGVLEELRDTKVVVNGRPRRLLDEVDVISSVSGGSYTAAYYGLFGDRIFSDFEPVFLKRDVHRALLAQVANPISFGALASPDFNRSDLAARWLGDNIFENKTFADMKARGGPAIIINASDINDGMTFSFVQQQFDFLCSNIDDYPVANAVMASSAVPGYFAPIAVRNYDVDCPERRDSWVSKALATGNTYSREYQVALALQRYSDPRRMPVVRLMDGGITDNLGVRGSMMSPVLHYGDVEDMAGAFDDQRLDNVSKVLVVVVNAQTYEEYDWSNKGAEPGLIDNVKDSFDAAIGIMNSETINLARRGFEQWAKHVDSRPSRRGKPPVDLQFAVLTYDKIRDPAQRRAFNQIPTTLSLDAKQVDFVRGLGHELLRDQPEYQRFVASLKGALPTAGPSAPVAAEPR
jgi:NTE family protein